MSAGIRFGYRNLEHTPEATFVVKQRGFVLICSIEKSDRTDSVEYDTGGSNSTTASDNWIRTKRSRLSYVEHMG